MRRKPLAAPSRTAGPFLVLLLFVAASTLAAQDSASELQTKRRVMVTSPGKDL
ncbi:MAG: hypothetical protein ACREJ2_08995 [Planctomycetota bacterium]